MVSPYQLALECNISTEDSRMFFAEGAVAFPICQMPDHLQQMFCYFPVGTPLRFPLLLHGNFAMRTNRIDLVVNADDVGANGYFWEPPALMIKC